MVNFNTFSLAQLNNAEFTGFFINLKKEITSTTADKLGLPAALNTQFGADLDRLQDQVYYATSSTTTADMLAADKKRDAIYRRIMLRLQLVKWGDDVRSLVTAREAVNTQILSKYDITVCDRAYHEETPILAGFIKDCRAKLTEDDIDALGIDNDLSALESANNAFVVAYNARVQEKSVYEAGVTKMLRSKLLEFYNQLVVITTFYANSTEEAHATKATDCQSFVLRANVLLSDAKARYLQRMTILKNKKAEQAPTPSPTEEAPTPSPSPEAVEGSSNPGGGNPGTEVNPQPEVVGPVGERDEAVSE